MTKMTANEENWVKTYKTLSDEEKRYFDGLDLFVTIDWGSFDKDRQAGLTTEQLKTKYKLNDYEWGILVEKDFFNEDTEHEMVRV